MKEKDIYDLAFEVIAYTSKSVFITGKAGSGKTTFLKKIAKEVDKIKVVVAPTGIAAINAGGVTLHSLLQLPLELFTPDKEGRDRFDLHRNLHKSKIELLQNLEMLIIDEISMVRADLLDATDYRLRKIRKNNLPFGGVQMIFIGDLFQLPPIVKNTEIEELRKFYKSSFFFDSYAIKDNIPICIELNKNYRQKDEEFLEILNKVRNNQVDPKTLQYLNERYISLKEVSEIGGYDNKEKSIILTTHNNSADKINAQELAKIDSKGKIYTAHVKGDFAENSYPTEYILELKEGARVMFVRNDGGDLSRFYNGKLGVVLELEDDKVIVNCDEGDIIELERNKWKNIRYKLNKETQEIEEENIGEFFQFPLRLAWAITIHRSQGLTFDNVVIDAAKSFVDGQVYVALSRCRTLQGIKLTSKISQNAIKANNEATIFENFMWSESDIKTVLDKEKKTFLISQLQKKFNFEVLKNILMKWIVLASNKKNSDKEDTLSMLRLQLTKANDIIEIGNSFQKQLENIILSDDKDKLFERGQKAIKYFHDFLTNNFKRPLYDYLKSIEKTKRVKKYRESIENMYSSICNIISNLENISYNGVDLSKGLYFIKIGEDSNVNIDKKEDSKGQSGRTKVISLEMLREGKTIQQIADERKLKKNTIEGHLISFISTGEIKGSELVEDEKLGRLMKEMANLDRTELLSTIKENLPCEYSYFEIKIALEMFKIL